MGRKVAGDTILRECCNPDTYDGKALALRDFHIGSKDRGRVRLVDKAPAGIQRSPSTPHLVEMGLLAGSGPKAPRSKSLKVNPAAAPFGSLQAALVERFQNSNHTEPTQKAAFTDRS